MIMDLKKAELGLRKNVYVATSDNETTLYGFFDMLKYKTILPLRVKMELQHIIYEYCARQTNFVFKTE